MHSVIAAGLLASKWTPEATGNNTEETRASVRNETIIQMFVDSFSVEFWLKEGDGIPGLVPARQSFHL